MDKGYAPAFFSESKYLPTSSLNRSSVAAGTAFFWVMMAFFKAGSFSYDGLLALYVPLTLFFIWVAITTPALLRAINRPDGDLVDLRAAGSPARSG